MSPDFILQTKALSKEFKGFVAVDKVDLRVRRGHIPYRFAAASPILAPVKEPGCRPEP